MANNAKLYDPSLYRAAGIDPCAVIDPKIVAAYESCADPVGLKRSLMGIISKNDEQIAINSFKWYGLPNGLTGNLIERILYYKGQGMLFYMPADEKFYFLPYALDGDIDVYGRFTAVTPVPYKGTPGSTENNGEIKPWIKGLRRFPVYDFQLDPMTMDKYETSCVLLYDRSQDVSETVIPRSTTNMGIIDIESDFMPMMRTALSNATGVQGIRVNSQDEGASVRAASSASNVAAITGQKWLPITASIDFQDLAPANVAKAEEFLLAMESVDNFRLGIHGLENGGLFQKKAHMLESEQQANTGSTGLIMNDKLWQRQNFCNIVNSLWGIGCWVEPSENVTGNDMDLNGVVGDTDEPLISGGGEQEDVSDISD